MRLVLQALVLISAFQTPTVTPSPTAAADRSAVDFALRFDHKGCHFEYLDTFTGTYSHVGSHPRVPFKLSDEQQLKIFRAIMAAKFFERPAELGLSRKAAADYELEVRNGGRRHTVRWTVDGNGGLMQHVLQTIFEVLENHPDVLRLPRRGDGCAGGPPAIR